MFTPATLHPLLENPAYTGRCVYNRRTLSKWHRLEDGRSVERHDEGVEKRPESDWVVCEDAWPALVDRDTFEIVQQNRKSSRENRRHVTGPAIRSDYLLTGLIFCGVCGGRLTGQTTTSGKGIRTKYYVCSTHHNGHHDRCPKRYRVPGKVIEDHVINLIKTDLLKLRDDDQLHQYVADEVKRLSGGHDDACEQLQRELAGLDQKLANLREHLTALDPTTADDLGLYEQAKLIGEQRQVVEQEIEKRIKVCPELPSADVIRQRASAVFDQLEQVIASATVEEKRELIAHFVQKIEADPDSSTIRINLYPAVFSRVIAGAGFEPATSGL